MSVGQKGKEGDGLAVSGKQAGFMSKSMSNCPCPCPSPLAKQRGKKVMAGQCGKQAGRVHVQLTGSDVIPNVMRGVVFQEAHHSEKSPLNLLSSNMFSDLSSDYFIPLFLVELESPLDRLKIYCPSKNAAWRGGSS